MNYLNASIQGRRFLSPAGDEVLEANFICPICERVRITIQMLRERKCGLACGFCGAPYEIEGKEGKINVKFFVYLH